MKQLKYKLLNTSNTIENSTQSHCSILNTQYSTPTTHFFTLLFLLLLFANQAQTQVTATLSPDSNKILIGDFLGIKLSAKFPKSTVVQLPPFKDSIGSLEIISTEKKDTATVGDEMIVSQRYTVSAYDSGVYTVAPQTIYYTQNGVTDSVITEEFLVEVATIPVDTTQNFKPIKAPLEVKRDWREYLIYIVIALLLIGLSIVIWWLFKKYYKPKQATPTNIIPHKVAHVWALKELQKLEQEKLWQKEEAKVYYSRLTDIFRKYLEYRFGLQALESTTDEIDLMLQRDEVKEEAKNEMVAMLRLADLVKFAKMQPLPEQSKNALHTTREFVKATAWKEENNIPSSTNKTKK